MRSAKSADLRRAFQNPHAWDSVIETISVSGMLSVGSIEIPAVSPVTVLCGPNGAGKSVILMAVRSCLDQPEELHRVGIPRRLNSGTVAITLRQGDERRIAHATFSNGELQDQSAAQLPFRYIGNGEKLFLMQREMSKFESKEDLINGAGTLQLVDEDLKDLSYIVKKSYGEVLLSEVEMDSVVPFFEVVADGHRYDSRTMGLGELSAFQIWWNLKIAEPSTIVLLEEPETFLSPSSQAAIGNFILKCSVKKRLCVIATSHSSHLLNALPTASKKYLYRVAGRSRLADPPSPRLLQSIGFQKTFGVLFFVEDKASKMFLEMLLQETDPILADAAWIKVCGGDGGIKMALRYLGGEHGPFVSIGMFDGDLKKSLMPKRGEQYLFLPEDQPIESIFRKLVEADTDGFCSVIFQQKNKIEEILSTLEGTDHHDWLLDLARALSLSSDQLFASMFTFWRRTEGREDLIRAWYSKLREMIDEAS